MPSKRPPEVMVTALPATGVGTRQRIEIVERKGLGHPDTISDAIAERFSDLYSGFSLAEFGDVAHHWVDKTMAIGGETDLRFGASRMVRPIRLLVVGKGTRTVGDVTIPVEEIARQAAADVFSQATPLLDTQTELVVEVALNDAIGAGRSASWYRPADSHQVNREARPRSNDTVMCNAYAPLSRLESLVLLIEMVLNSGEVRSHLPALGSDIKVLARRVDSAVDLVGCVPSVARLVPSRAEYDSCLAVLYELITDLCRIATPEFDVRLALNTRDAETVYLTHTGTALDTGDVGVVGRGNKLNGVIPLCREAGIEAPCGKNPTYHGGRIYSIVAQSIADRIWQRLSLENYVNIVAANGDPIHLPSFLAVKTLGAADEATEEIRAIVSEVLQAVDRPAGELPAALQEMMLPPVERLTATAWVSTLSGAGLTAIDV